MERYIHVWEDLQGSYKDLQDFGKDTCIWGSFKDLEDLHNKLYESCKDQSKDLAKIWGDLAKICKDLTKSCKDLSKICEDFAKDP